MKAPYIVLIVVAGLAMMALIPILIFTALGKRTARLRQQYEHEGVVARTGHGWVTLVARSYRGPRRRAGALIQNGRGELLLTQRGLHALGVCLEKGGSFDVPQADFAHWRASLVGRQVHLNTSHPPNATGEVELRAYANDLPGFLSALRERGVAVS